MTKKLTSCLAVAAVVLLLVQCSSIGYRSRPAASDYARTHSYAIPQSTRTSLSRALQDDVKAHPGQSGFRVLATGRHSLEARIQMVQMAESSLDLQYYAINDGITSNLLIEAIIRAAQRGVRVRFLIDDITVSEIQDSLAVLDKMDNIEVRIFNPMTTKDQPFLSRVTGLVTDLPQITKRMHNKALIADNQVAIIGGRNLGDEYFDADPDISFKDIDVLTAGPITAKISDSFDAFWNSDNSFPLITLYDRETDPKFTTDMRAKLSRNWETQYNTSQGKELLDSTFLQSLKSPKTGLIWAKAGLSADDPHKIETPEDNVVSKPLQRLQALGNNAQHEFVIISSYFVPGDDGEAWLESLEKKSVHVRILTNSLASTDVVAVHSGYERYRERLLQNGIELYELKPIDNRRTKQRPLATSAPSYASLHAKLYIIDRKDTVIGSFNYDPRSDKLNTEISLTIHSPVIAEQLHKMFERAILPDSSYRLGLEEGNLIWTGTKKGNMVEHTSEPAGLWRGMENFFISLMPVEDQL